MKVTYIYHDCFFVELQSCQIIFDFWKQNPRISDSIEKIFNPLKPLYVFVSHFHKDHYNPDIFLWNKFPGGIKYIISPDVRRRARPFFTPESIYKGPRHTRPEQVITLTEGKTFRDDILSVHAFGSTDAGCSWLVETEGKKIFHAGDLNAWIWKDESAMEEVQEAISLFRAKLKNIHQATKHIDLAMFPVDSRIGSDYWTGAYIFVREFEVDTFIPMHFGLGDTPREEEKFVRDAVDFNDYANPEGGNYIALTGPYSSALLRD